VADAAEAVPSILRHRPFLRFWISRVLSTLSVQMLAVAVGWQLYALTGSAFDLGLVGLVQFLPVLLLTLPAGHMADRGDRRAIVAACQFSLALLAGLLLLGSLQGWLGREAIFVLVGMIGCARAIEAPTMASLLPGLVPRSMFPRAAAWSASATQTAQILGPALGGLLFALAPGAAYGTAAVLLLVGAGAAASILLPKLARPPERPGLAALLSGFRFVLRHPLVLGAISLDLFAVRRGGGADADLRPRHPRHRALGAWAAAGGAGGGGAADLDLAGQPSAAAAGRGTDVRRFADLRGGDHGLRALGEPAALLRRVGGGGGGRCGQRGGALLAGAAAHAG
jgi:MFS family permease